MRELVIFYETHEREHQKRVLERAINMARAYKREHKEKKEDLPENL